MSNTIPQFGVKPEKTFINRISAYAVVFNRTGKILALQVRGSYYLPGGGIDPGEDSEEAVIRETREESGCEITDLIYLGQANQYFQATELGPLNKLGTFYTASMTHIDDTRRIEDDHSVYWLTADEFLNSPADDFQKWAVQKVLSQM